MKTRRIRLTVLGISVLVIAVVLTSLPNDQPAQRPADHQIGTTRLANKPFDTKFDPALAALMRPQYVSEIEAAGVIVNAAKRDFVRQDGTIQIVAETRSDPNAAAAGLFPAALVVRNQIEALGGLCETTYRNLVQARMAPAGIQALAESEFVALIRLPLRPFTTAISEGVGKTGADAWKSLEAYRTNGQVPKVAVLDLGFSGHASLLGSDLPSSVTTRSFRSDGNLTPNQPHGTACAEIVYDMCPTVDLYLVNFSTDVEQHNAVNWLISEGVQIISYSVGWTNSGDGKGTGPICVDVERAASAGIIWCSSSGNDANLHWEGTYSDTFSNRYHNFTNSDEILDFWVPSNSLVSVWLNWDDWGNWNSSTDRYSGSGQDYDLELYYWHGSHWDFVASSYGIQNGTQWPTEAIGYWYSNTPTYWGVAIYRYSTSRNCKLELFTRGSSGYTPIEYCVPAGSLTIPADAPGAIASGATDAVSDEYHVYSSRGPAHDGRMKPDFASPSGVTGTTYGNRGFYGTSASAPHLAGAFGLLRSKTRYSLDQIRQILEARAVDLGATGDDNQYGVGRLDIHK